MLKKLEKILKKAEVFQSVVRLGAYEGKGMPGFPDFSERDVNWILAYIDTQVLMQRELDAASGGD